MACGTGARLGTIMKRGALKLSFFGTFE